MGIIVRWVLGLFKGGSWSYNFVFILILAALFMALLIPGYQSVKGFLGFDTVKTLKAKNAQQAAALDQIANTNQDLTNSLDQQTKSGNVTLAIVTNTIITENKAKTEFQASEQKREQEIAALKQQEAQSPQDTTQPVAEKSVTKTVTEKLQVLNPIKKHKSTVPVETVRQKISRVQITSIWDNYCKVEPDNKTCLAMEKNQGAGK